MQTALRIRWIDSLDLEGDDSALDLSEVADAHAGNRRKRRAKGSRTELYLRPDSLQTDRKRVIDRYPHTEMIGIVLFPVLEAFRIGPKPITIGRGPFGRVQIEHGRFELVDDFVADIEKTDSARTAQELAAGSRKKIALQLRDIERRYGSLIRGMLVERKRPPAPLPPGAPDAPFVSFTNGMAELIEALVVALDRVDIRFESPVAALQLTGDGYDVRLMSGEELATDAVILATPAFVTADLVTPLDGEMATLLRQIPYASSATITMAFRRQDVERQGGGRGFVVPHVEDREITAVTWVTSKFAHRAPDDIVLLRAFVGRAGRDWAIELDDDALLQIVRAELERMTGLYAEPLTTSIFRWRRAMPQYVVGHLTRLARIDERLLALPGLYLAGAAYRGVGIPDCIESGNNAALAVAAGLGLLARARPAAAGH